MFSKIYTSDQPVWKETHAFLFNELILSWNGIRPEGNWTFWVSVVEGEWLKYAEWGSNGQRSFRSQARTSRCYQDVVISENLSSRFQIRVEGKEMEKLKRLRVCLSNVDAYQLIPPGPLEPILIENVPKLSQMVLNHPRRKDLCSPTSTAIVSNFLQKKTWIDPIDLGENSLDQTFDIYGNWILNVAESYSRTQLPCHVERLHSFQDLHKLLLTHIPVVVSIQGPLTGSPKPYAKGHLMCVIGYQDNRVHCIDPGFDSNERTLTTYPLEDFLTAWSRRKNLAYVFSET